MQLQEGSVISVNCAVCGQESFRVTLLSGKQRLRCSNRSSNYYTVVKVEKSSNGDLQVQTWSD